MSKNQYTSANKQAYMISLLESLAPVEGYNLTSSDSVRILRSDRPLSRTPVLYDPGIVIVCQGQKRGYFGNKTYIYDANQYLAVSVPVPFTMETDASKNEPLLAIYMHLDFQVVTELMLLLDESGIVNQASPLSMMSSPMDEHMYDSVIRLLDALNKKPDDVILGPGLLKEIYYRVLVGPQGSELRAALTMQKQMGKVGKAIQLIHHAYKDHITIQQLAIAAGMSTAALHYHFKAITSESPIQYLKSVRLHQARLFMVRRGMTAAKASSEVGYESQSQFNREFKRLFNRTPAQEAKYLRENFSLPPEHVSSIYVSSH